MKNVNESGESHQEQALLFQQKHSPLLESSQQQQQQTMSKTKRKCHEQHLSLSAIDFQIQRKHRFISPKTSFRRELRNSEESVNFESENKFQSLYCIDESAAENEFSTLSEDTSSCRNQSVIPKSAQLSQIRKLPLGRHRTQQL